MAFTSIGNRGTALSSGNNQSSLALAVNGNVAVGRLLVVVVAVDNLVTTSGAVTTSNAMTSGVTDAAGNTYTLARGQTFGTVSQTGAEVTVWYTVATTQLNSGQNVTATFRTPANADASAMTAWEFSVATGNGVVIDGATGTGSATTVGSLDVTTANAERLRIRGMAHEHNVSTGMTVTASWTALTAAVSGAGTSATEMAVRGEFRIVTATGAASNPTGIASVNNASAYVALKEVAVYNDSQTETSATADSSDGTVVVPGASVKVSWIEIEAAVAALTASQTDSAATGDSATVTLITSASRTESAATGDTQSAATPVAVQVSWVEIQAPGVVLATQAESAATSDSQSAVEVAVASRTETAATGDTSSAVLVALASQTDTAVTGDSSSAALGSQSGSVTETAATGDAATTTWITSASQTETAATGDSATTAWVATVAQSETAGTSDTASPVGVALGSLTETAATGDVGDAGSRLLPRSIGQRARRQVIAPRRRSSLPAASPRAQ